MKKICYFGIYDPTYSRNSILIRGLRECGCEVVECRVDPKQIGGFKKYWKLWQKGRGLKKHRFDHVIIGFPGHSVVWLARIIFGKLITFDAFLSLYDSNVFDRKLYSRYSFRGLKDWLLDWCSCSLAQVVLVDTFAHRDYFSQTFGLDSNKFIRVLIGADETVFKPTPTISDDQLKIHFHGNFIPLQGIEYIIEAAKRLENTPVGFTIVGAGQQSQEIGRQVEELNLRQKVEIHGKLPLATVAEYVNKADLCLGIFGRTDKTKRVIPNKVYEYVAAGKPVITADTPAIRELFTHKENIYLCEVASAESLARAIEHLVTDKELRQQIGQAAGELFRHKLTARQISVELLESLDKLR